MKKAKSTIPKITEYTCIQYEIKCPHCKTYLQGGFNERVLKYKCPQCSNPIIINWEESIIEIK